MNPTIHRTDVITYTCPHCGEQERYTVEYAAGDWGDNGRQWLQLAAVEHPGIMVTQRLVLDNGVGDETKTSGYGYFCSLDCFIGDLQDRLDGKEQD